MGGRRIALVLLAGLVVSGPAAAQPAGTDDIGLGDPTGDSTGDPAGEPVDEAVAEADARPPVVKDPKLAKNWLAGRRSKLVQKGDALARRKKPDEAKAKYENAVTAYEKSIEAGDDLGVYSDLAAVEEKLGKLDRAATHYRARQPGARPACART